MQSNKMKWSLSLALFAIVTSAHADNAANKTYQLTHLQQAVASDNSCNKYFGDLKKLAKKPLSLSFANKESAEFNVSDQNNKIINHTYKIIKQSNTDNTINRLGMGSFELDNGKWNYVLQISADAKKPDEKFVYPIIISNEQAHCVYTGELIPDHATVAAFRKNIQSGNHMNGADLTTQ